MFVKIDNFKNALDVDTIIKKTRDNNELSPEVAMDILRMSNQYGNIKKLLQIIHNLGESKWGDYKEFVLSCVDGREVSEKTFEILNDIAKAGGYENELASINAKEKIYPTRKCDVIYREGKYIQEDLSKYDVLHHKHDNDVCVWDAKLPKFADFSECAKGVDFNMTDCSAVKKFAFADNDDVIRFIHIGRPLNNEKRGAFPKVLDLSQANRVAFDSCDFEGVDEIKFKQGSVISFIFTSNHPKKLDFSMCSDLVGDFHAQEVEEIVFSNLQQADVFLLHIHNFKGKAILLSQLEAQKMSEERKAEKQEEKEKKKENRKNKPSFMKRIFSKNLEN